MAAASIPACGILMKATAAQIYVAGETVNVKFTPQPIID